MHKINHYPAVLTIAGSDSSGGAGIQADIKTMSALGCYSASVITALTAQNTQGVKNILPIPQHFVAEQLDAVFADLSFSAIKIGMLFQPDIIECVAKKLTEWHAKNVVIDPVMIAKSGCKLISDASLAALKKYLMPKAFLLTPNMDEAAALLGYEIISRQDMEQAASDLANEYNINVIIKGGHALSEDCNDVLYAEQKFHWFAAKRISTKNTHGTGCTFSSAIASFLAQGYDLLPAIQLAKDYLTNAIVAAKELQIGKGCGPLFHSKYYPVKIY